MDNKQLNQVRAQVKIPQQLTDAAKRIMQAGRKVMFSKETRSMVMESLSKDAPIEERVGGAISDLMMVLWYKSNQSMPPQLIAPCATLLACDAIEFLIEAGENMDAGNVLEASITMTLHRFGVNPENMKQYISGINKDNVGQMLAMPPKRQQPQAPQQPGMIQGG
jgi:hypothetical protein